MTNLDELIREAEQLPTAEKWQLVKQLLRSLEEEQHKTCCFGLASIPA